jgi:hypothetical protein
VAAAAVSAVPAIAARPSSRPLGRKASRVRASAVERTVAGLAPSAAAKMPEKPALAPPVPAGLPSSGL